VEFRILGPLEVVEDGNPVALGTLKERLVLSVLLLHANEFISRERLIDDLWGEAPPPTAHKAVNVYLSKLRKTLVHEGNDPIETAAGGYRLRVEPELVDAGRMQRLVAEARESVSNGELQNGADLFQKALSLWRGPTLAGLQLESRGRDEVAQLEELRLAALMERIDCDLALGRHEQVLPELNVLVREHPLRERLRAQQMLALYRADRQAEALDAYVEARGTLVDDLGIEPSEALQRLQQAILRHDSSLETPTGTAAVNGLALAAPSQAPPNDVVQQGSRRWFRPRRWQLVLAGVALLAGAVTGAAVLATSASATPKVGPNSLVQLNPHTGKPILVAQVGSLPGPIAITPTAIWTANYGSDDVSRLDLETHKVETRGVTPGQPFDIVFDREGNAWVTNTPANDQPVRRSVVIRLGSGAGGTLPGPIGPSHVDPVGFPLPMAGLEAFGSNHVWVVVGFHGPLPGDNRVAVVDVRDDQVSVLHLDESATSVAYGYGTAWIGTYGANLGATTDNRIEAFRAGHPKPKKIVLVKQGANWGPVSIAVGGGAVWAATCCDSGNQLWKINPITLRVVLRVDLPAVDGGPGELAVGAGGVWMATDHFLDKIDPHTGKIIRRFHLVRGYVGQLCGVAATPRQLWVTTGHIYCDTIGS
jgi:DNA-binding SARP family transcriptional activator